MAFSACLAVFMWWRDGYEFGLPCLSGNIGSRENLRALGFRSGDVIVIGPESRGGRAVGLWPRQFWSDCFDRFMSHVIESGYDRKVMDPPSHPVPPCVGAVVLYTEEDWAIYARRTEPDQNGRRPPAFLWIVERGAQGEQCSQRRA